MKQAIKTVRILVLCAMVVLGFQTMAPAMVIIDQHTSAFFRFDIPTVTTEDIVFNSAAYGCSVNAVVDCNVGSPNQLDALASMQLDFGSAPDDLSLGTVFLVNPLFQSINNLAAPFSVISSEIIGSSIILPVSPVFVRVSFVNDVFGIDELRIDNIGGGMFQGTLINVPEASTMLLLCGGLTYMVLFKRLVRVTGLP